MNKTFDEWVKNCLEVTRESVESVEKFASYAVEKQLEAIKRGIVMRTAVCRFGMKNLSCLPQLLNASGVFCCVFVSVEGLPAGAFQLKGRDGSRLVCLGTDPSAALDCDSADAYFASLSESMPDLPVIEPEASFFESDEKYIAPELSEKAADMFINRDNVRLLRAAKCIDGSGDVVLRFEETDGVPETLVSVMSDSLECGFRFKLEKYEIKTFRFTPSGKVRELNFLEGLMPFDEGENIAEAPYGNYEEKTDCIIPDYVL